MHSEATVRAIDYEIVPASRARSVGLPAEAVEKHLSTVSKVAVLRCVDDSGEKLTAFGDAGQLRHLIDSGEASNPAGMKLSTGTFPVVLRGWLPVA